MSQRHSFAYDEPPWAAYSKVGPTVLLLLNAPGQDLRLRSLVAGIHLTNMYIATEIPNHRQVR
jgi:hypothetical protein